MSKKAVWLVSIISAAILCVGIVLLALFFSRPISEEPVEEVPSLITPEQRAEATEVFRSGDASGFIEKIIQDFAANGIEFDFSNPDHLQYLNVPEVAP